MIDEVVPSDIISVKQCAKYMKVNHKTIYDMVKLGELPGAQYFRGTIRIYKPAVVAWLTAGVGTVKQRKRSK